MDEESTPSSTKTLSGSFGKVYSLKALCKITQKERENIIMKEQKLLSALN